MQNIKEILSFLGALAMTIEHAKEDGKIDINDLPLVYGPVTKLIPALSGMENVRAEFEALDEEQKNELVESFAAEFNLTDDEAEKMVERGLRVALELATFVRDL